MKYDLYVVTTADFKSEKNEDGDVNIISGKRREFRSLKQAKKFIPDWLLQSKFNPNTGAPIVIERIGRNGQPLTASIVLESRDFEDDDEARKRGLALSKPGTPAFSKVYGMQKAKSGWVIADVVAPRAAKQQSPTPPPLPPALPAAPPANPEGGAEDKPTDPPKTETPKAPTRR